MRSLTYVEIDIDYCGNTYGTAPCTAALGVTGDKKCFNGQKTCQDLANYDFDGRRTLRFAKPTADLPADIPAIPSLKSVTLSPATISFGENLGQRATLECTFEDHPDSDTGLDKYFADRAYNPYRTGTFWGKFRARFPYLTGRAIRVYRGFVGQSLEEMTIQHFVIDKTEGPSPTGTFSITARDMLKLADNAKAQAPRLSNGSLFAGISAAATAIVLNPVGIGNVDYDGDGYLAIAGKEIVSFVRDCGQDAPCVLMLHMNGANLSTVFTDDGPNASTVTPVNGPIISTAQSVFGGASASFAAASAHLTCDGSEAFDFGTGDFTIDFRVRFVAVNVRQVIVDTEPLGGGADDYLAVVLRSDGFLAVEINGAQVLASDAVRVVNTWYHVMVSKRANTIRLFIGGVLQGNAVKELSDFGTGPDRPVIGARGDTAAGDFFGGFIDEFRIVKGRGMKSAAFTIPAAAYAAGVGDNVTIVRAQFGTVAVAHTNQDRVQPCLYFSQVDPALILLNLFEQYGGIDREFLPVTSWLAETGAYLQRFYTALIAEPTGVSILASELIEQANLAVWWDEVLRSIRLQVLRGIATDADEINGDNRIERTFSSSEQLDKRVSQVWTYFGIINPLKSVTDADNYRSCAATVNLELETFYGSPAIRKIFSRWIPAFGRSIALEVNNILLTRYQIPPRRFSFELQREGGLIPELATGYQLSGPFIQDDEGMQVAVPIRINRLGRTDAKYQIEAEEVFAGAVGDLNNRTVIIDRDTFNANLRTLHDAIYPAIVDPTGITLTLIVEEGVKVGSTNAANPSLTIGTFPVGLPITVINKGRIGGKGGNGQGSDGQATGSGANGQAGGTALYTRYPITVDNTDGEIWGGGGSGGTSRTSYQSSNVCFNINRVGGGGAGVSPGTSGAGASRQGTTEAGGIGGSGTSFGATVTSGNGGNPGMPGTIGSFVGTVNCNQFGFNWTPGAAGKAIDGVSYVTFTGAGDRKGPETG